MVSDACKQAPVRDEHELMHASQQNPAAPVPWMHTVLPDDSGAPSKSFVHSAAGCTA